MMLERSFNVSSIGTHRNMQAGMRERRNSARWFQR